MPNTQAGRQSRSPGELSSLRARSIAVLGMALGSRTVFDLITPLSSLLNSMPIPVFFWMLLLRTKPQQSSISTPLAVLLDTVLATSVLQQEVIRIPPSPLPLARILDKLLTSESIWMPVPPLPFAVIKSNVLRQSEIKIPSSVFFDESTEATRDFHPCRFSSSIE
jgi:hypothetical protein